MSINISHSTYYKMFYNIIFSDNKNIILEPISCIIKIILLKYKEEGVKISISNNVITYNEPSYLQGLFRKLNGDAREDLHNIYNPLLKMIEWYPPDKNYVFKYLYERCLEGFNLLLQSYNTSSTISHTLELYKKLITDVLNQNSKEISKTDSPLLDQLKDFWKEEEINLIHQTLLLIEKSNKEGRDVYIKIIYDIVVMKEKKLYDFIQKSSTTY